MNKEKKWEYDRELKWHTLTIEAEEDAFVFVYITEAGDYAISAMREGDAAGGEVEYEPNLTKAKKYAENLIKSGTYKNYFL